MVKRQRLVVRGSIYSCINGKVVVQHLFSMQKVRTGRDPGLKPWRATASVDNVEPGGPAVGQLCMFPSYALIDKNAYFKMV